MSFIGGLLERLTEFATNLLDSAGYLGLFLLMAGESYLLPIPSEAVMPIAGILIAQGNMSWFGAIFWSSMGSFTGTMVGYYTGAFGLLPLVRKYGRYVLIQERHLDAVHRFFERHGAFGVLICRFIPGIRHVSSIPLGAVRMPMAPFLLASMAGAITWNCTLLFIGYKVGQNPEVFHRYILLFAVIGVALLAAYIIYEVRHTRQERARMGDPDEPQPPM